MLLFAADVDLRQTTSLLLRSIFQPFHTPLWRTARESPGLGSWLLFGCSGPREAPDWSGPTEGIRHPMSSVGAGNQSGSAIAWGLRSYAWLIVLCIVQVLLVAPVLQTLQPVSYEATALVVARRVQLSPQALPRFAQAVFDHGVLAQEVTADPAVGGDPTALIPQRLRVVAPQDSVVFPVVGIDSNPEQAARIANVAALKFVSQLNKPGAGVGNFALQDAAAVPTEPAGGRSGLATLVLVGLVAGGVLGIGLIVALITWRRPIVNAEAIEDLLEIPAIGTVTLPRFKAGEFFSPRQVPGLAAVVRAVADAPTTVLFITSPPDAESIRQRLSMMLAIAVRRSRPISFRASHELEEILHEVVGEGNTVGTLPSPRARVELNLIDGEDPLDNGLPGRLSTTILVVPEGIPQERLRTVAAHYLYGELYGIVLIRIRRARTLPQVEKLDSRTGPGPASADTEETTVLRRAPAAKKEVVRRPFAELAAEGNGAELTTSHRGDTGDEAGQGNQSV